MSRPMPIFLFFRSRPDFFIRFRIFSKQSFPNKWQLQLSEIKRCHFLVRSKTSPMGVKAERYRVSIPSSHSSGGGTSGRVSAFCLSRPTLNPSTYVPFLVQNCCQSILAGHQSFSNTQQSKWCILFLCLICFLSSFAFTECINFNLTMYQEKGEIYPTRVWERP